VAHVPWLTKPVREIVRTTVGSVRVGTDLAAGLLGSPDRGLWVDGVRCWVEVRDRGSRSYCEGVGAVARALGRLPNVARVDVNAPLQRLVIHFTAPPTSVQGVLRVVAHVEEAWWREYPPVGDPPVRVTLPGDPRALALRATTVAADLAGLAVAAATSSGRLRLAPASAPALPTLVDTQPRLRRLLEDRVGTEAADALIGATNAMVQGASGAGAALGVDLASRVMTTGAAQANRASWLKHEPRLAAAAGSPDVAARWGRPPRPQPAVDWYSEVSGAAGLLTAAALAATGRAGLAGRALMASAPKATRYGQQAFVSTVGRALCQREDGLLLRGEALGLLGSVDCIVVDPHVLVTGEAVVSEVRGASGRARDILWAAATAELADGTLDPGWHGTTALSPTRVMTGVPENATFLVTRTPQPLAQAVLEAARAAGLVCCSLDRPWLGALRSSFDELQPVSPSPAPEDDQNGRERESTALSALVAAMQAEGKTVLVLGQAHASVAMPTADIVVGLGARPAWTADVLLPGLGAAWHLVNAVPAARTVNRRCVELSAGGTALQGLLLLSPRQRRLPGPVVTGGALALVMGWRAGREVMSRPLPVVAPTHPWHALPPVEVSRLLPPRLDRKTPEAFPSEAPAPGERWLPSAVRSASHMWSVVREDLDDPMSPVLATGAAASAVLGSPGDAALVSAVLLGNAVLSGVQRLRAEQILTRLLTGDNTPARVLLEATGPDDALGHAHSGYVDIPGHDLVAGDIIEVRAGEVVPADARLLTVDAVEVDESALTGESLPVRKSVAATPGAPLAERTCMLYEGTVVLTGVAAAVVTATGAATESGRALLSGPSSSQNVGLHAQLSRLTGSVLPLTMAGGLAVTGLGLLRGVAVRDAVASGVAIAVAAVPEGLPLIATLAQQAAARRLAAAGVLVRAPAAIEVLGRVEVICFDKTGTLTANRLSVKVTHRCPGVSERALQAAAGLASPAATGDGHVQSTDAAVAAYSGGGRLPRDAELPFRSGRAFSAGLSGETLAVKGAPETILAASGESAADWPVVDRLAAQGLRVLAVAERTLTPEEAEAARGDDEVLEGLAGDGLTMLGFLGIADTVRPGAEALLTDLRRRGVRPVVITGDHPVTAAAILSELGHDVPVSQVLTGDEWGSLSRRQRLETVGRISVFARMSPEQKVQVVQTLESGGTTTAMVGDGANDAAAIRAASVGVGVSTSGSDPARGAADVVLLDGRIELLAAGLDEGSRLWRSVQSAVTMLLGGNAGEVAFTALGVAISGTAPMNARQLLLVNLLTDALPAAALAVSATPARPGETRRGLDEEELWRLVVERGVTTTIGATSAWAFARLTGRPTRAATVGLVALVATQLGQTIVDSPTPLVVATAAGSMAALGVAISTPGVSQSLGCTPLGPVAWAQALGCAASATVLSAVTPAVRQMVVAARAAGREVETSSPVAAQQGTTHEESAQGGQARPAKADPALVHRRSPVKASSRRR